MNKDLRPVFKMGQIVTQEGGLFLEIILMLIASVISAIIAISIKGKQDIMQPTKIMILGVAIMIIPIYIQNEPIFNYHGYEIYILVFGFILTIVGLFMKGKNNEK
ncbi:hypothetical protein GLW20_04470 [Virgibacillus halodenitrificans]|nr:hypothetical protein [Virgibacillus halodenitrificans]